MGVRTRGLDIAAGAKMGSRRQGRARRGRSGHPTLERPTRPFGITRHRVTKPDPHREGYHPKSEPPRAVAKTRCRTLRCGQAGWRIRLRNLGPVHWHQPGIGHHGLPTFTGPIADDWQPIRAGAGSILGTRSCADRMHQEKHRLVAPHLLRCSGYWLPAHPCHGCDPSSHHSA
jgi:hypothetical protein